MLTAGSGSGDRDQWELLCGRPELLPRAVEEICRYDSANRDETAFADADRFDITHPPPNRHLTFGHGVHGCLGAGLARTELTVALELLTQRHPDLRLAPDQPIPTDPVFVSRGPTTLPVLL